jgi:hypothetical protein
MVIHTRSGNATIGLLSYWQRPHFDRAATRLIRPGGTLTLRAWYDPDIRRLLDELRTAGWEFTAAAVYSIGTISGTK